MSSNFFPGMPQDPFEGDPEDPSHLLEPDEPFAPLTDQERREVLADLAAIREFRSVLAPEGLLGIVMPCEDCGDDHYYGWDVMETHFLTLLAGHNSPVHEPEFAPDITRYAPWEYCAGFVDGRRRSRGAG